jgi:heat shock protein HtpX
VTQEAGSQPLRSEPIRGRHLLPPAPQRSPVPTLSDQISSNKRRAALVVGLVAGAVFVVVAAVLALAGFVLVGLLVAVVAAAAAAAWVWRRGEGVVSRALGAREADPAAFARLHNLVEGLCATGGVPKPALYVVDDDAPNALAFGRDPHHAALVVTTGLMDKLDRVELEGVLAHELSHIKSYDTRLGTLGASLAFLGARVPAAVVGHEREPLADVNGVAWTQYPPGLISALEKLRGETPLRPGTGRAVTHLWLSSTAATHPPLDERIAALREL